MNDNFQRFLDAYLSVHPNRVVFTRKFPEAMKASEIDAEGWIEWKPIVGSLTESDYYKLEKTFQVLFPKSFINWHKAYYFLDADCSIIRLPSSSPTEPLESLRQNLDWFIPEQLIPQKIYPFADEGNDSGPLVFDARQPMADNEFPIRVYEQEFGGDLKGLSEIIFSSFPKLLDCLTHYLIELKKRKSFEIIPDFFRIDPSGAGKTGIDYWLSRVIMQKENFEELGY